MNLRTVVKLSIIFALTLVMLNIFDLDPVQAQSSEYPDPPQQLMVVPKRTLLISEELSPRLQNLIKQTRPDVYLSPILYTQEFDQNTDGIAEFSRLRAAIEEKVSNDFSGYVTLDWEGKILEWLHESPDSPKYKKAVDNMIEVVQFCQQLRPKAKWGFYAIPLREYWNRNDDWRARARGLSPLVARVDVLFPSVYDFYEEDAGSDDKAYVKENIELALELSQGKPVFPFIWKRYHNSNKTLGLWPIPDIEFKSHVQAALDAKFNDRMISGVNWWGADYYWERRDQLPELSRVDKPHEVYIHEIHEKQLHLLSKLLKLQ